MNNSRILSLSLCVSLLSPSLALAAQAPYTDVLYTEHFESIYWTKEWGIFEGYADGSFKSENEINRAELAKVLVLGSGLEESAVDSCAEGATQTFSDVPLNEWYTSYVYCAQAKGWVSGDDNADTFRPGDPVLMGETFKMTVESQYGSPDVSYEGTAWYDIYINFLAAHKIMEVEEGSYTYPYLGVAYHDMFVGFSSDLSSKMQRMDIAELLYRLRVVFEENNGEPYDVFLTLEEMTQAYGTEFEITDSTLAIRDTHFGFSAENIPLPWTMSEFEEFRVFVLDPSGFENGNFTTWYLLYPSPVSDPDPYNSSKTSEGYRSYFQVNIRAPEATGNASYDFENEEGVDYAFNCYGSTNYLLDVCTITSGSLYVDAEYTNFSSY